MAHSSSFAIETTLVRMEPVLAELHLRIDPDPKDLAESWVRLLGPSCLYASTVEIAYPAHSLARPGEFRILLPEPSYWEPETPFVYHLLVEDRAQGQGIRSRRFPLPLRRFQVLGGRCRLNGKDLHLVGRRVAGVVVEALDRFRAEGCNALVLEADAGHEAITEATRRGFLCFRRKGKDADLIEGPLLGPGAPVEFAWPKDGFTPT